MVVDLMKLVILISGMWTMNLFLTYVYQRWVVGNDPVTSDNIVRERFGLK